MKIAFTGDFHFGFSNDAAVQAQRALLDAASNADVIVCGGDLFDTRIPRQETLDEALNIFSKTKSAMKYGNVGIFEQTGGKQEPISGFSPIIAIHGSHERRSRGLVNPVQLLDSAKAFINIHGRKIVIEKGGERVCFRSPALSGGNHGTHWRCALPTQGGKFAPRVPTDAERTYLRDVTGKD